VHIVLYFVQLICTITSVFSHKREFPIVFYVHLSPALEYVNTHCSNIDKILLKLLGCQIQNCSQRYEEDLFYFGYIKIIYVLKSF